MDFPGHMQPNTKLILILCNFFPGLRKKIEDYVKSKHRPNQRPDIGVRTQVLGRLSRNAAFVLYQLHLGMFDDVVRPSVKGFLGASKPQMNMVVGEYGIGVPLPHLVAAMTSRSSLGMNMRKSDLRRVIYEHIAGKSLPRSDNPIPGGQILDMIKTQYDRHMKRVAAAARKRKAAEATDAKRRKRGGDKVAKKPGAKAASAKKKRRPSSGLVATVRQLMSGQPHFSHLLVDRGSAQP